MREKMAKLVCKLQDEIVSALEALDPSAQLFLRVYFACNPRLTSASLQLDLGKYLPFRAMEVFLYLVGFTMLTVECMHPFDVYGLQRW